MNFAVDCLNKNECDLILIKIYDEKILCSLQLNATKQQLNSLANPYIRSMSNFTGPFCVMLKVEKFIQLFSAFAISQH